ncbi:MAG: dihydropteroate synthase [Thermodesulfobacteriota bacterium]|jgi:5-methyltetrahydrofolate--homocysteine methyltransferase
MLIVGERINTSRKPVNEAVEKRDAGYITADVQKQVKAGADYIDVNSGSRIGSEMEDLSWLVGVIEAAVDVPLALDSPDPQVLLAMVKKVKQKPLVNSTTAEASRFEAMKAVMQERECDIVALCMDERGIPQSVDQVLENGTHLVENLTKLGIPIERIHLDPMIQPISVNKDNGILAVETIRRLHQEFPGVRSICGLSNISFGLPHRLLVNRLFMVLCIGAGLTGAIVDPLDPKMMTHIIVAETLVGKDEFCLKYLKANRAGILVA